MATHSSLLTISFLVEENLAVPGKIPFPMQRTDDEIRDAVLDAISTLLNDREDLAVEWMSTSTEPLEGKPATGRCAVCNCWVFDVENCTQATPTHISRGAVVNGQYRCDEHLPHGHPVCFAGRGYDGPVPGEEPENP